ncbi:g6687 [Coccomyxa elongata]
MGEPRSSLTKIRGLPYDATEEEIKEFFQGFETSLIHICRRDGRATGEAYVEFKSAAIAEEASKVRNQQVLRHRYLEIFEIPEKNVQHIKQAQGLVDPFPGWVLRMRGLPYSANAEDVIHFFEGIEIQRGSAGIAFTCTPDGRPKGEAYVEFPSEDAQKEALKRHKNEIGDRYIELFVSSKANMIQAVQQSNYYLGQSQHAVGPSMLPHPLPPLPLHAPIASFGAPYGQAPYGQGAPMQSVVSADGSTLRLRGLPYAAGIDEITSFFAGFALAPDGIQVVTKPDKEGNQMGTGVAYVRFSNPEEAERARKERHRAQMGARYIECLPFTASHYTSPPQVPAPPPPFALGHYPAGMAAATAAVRPYPPIGSLGRGLPPQPQQQSYDDARLYAQQRAGPGMAAPRGAGAAGRARGAAPGRGGRPMSWGPSQPPGRPGMPPGQAPPPSYGVQTPSPRAGRGYQPQASPRGGGAPGRPQPRMATAEYAAQQAAAQQHQQMLLQQQYIMHQHMLQQQHQRYLAGGWGPVYSEAQMGVQGAPPSPSWYSLQGGLVSSGASYPQGSVGGLSSQFAAVSMHEGTQRQERPAAAGPVDPEALPPVSELAAAVLASPGVPSPEPLSGGGSPPLGAPLSAAGGASPAGGSPHSTRPAADLEVGAAAEG